MAAAYAFISLLSCLYQNQPTVTPCAS
jgi:hypothetical protein